MPPASARHAAGRLLRGRVDDAPQGAHRRRRRRSAASPARRSSCPRSGFAVAPIFDEPEERWERVGSIDQFTRGDLQAGGDHAGRADRRGRQDHRLRPPGRPETFPEESPDTYIAISTRCAHLGCPVRFVAAAENFICPCHGGVYDFEGKVHRRPAGAPPRPLPDPGARRPQLEVGPRYSVTSQLEPVRARDPGEFTGGVWNVPLPAAPDHRAAAVGSEPMGLNARHATASPTSPRPKPKPREAGEAGDGRRSPSPARCEGGAGRPGRLGRRAHRRLQLPHRDALPQGAEGHQLVLHARLGDAVRVRRAGGHRRVPGDVLHAVADAGLRLDHPPHQRRLPRRVRARHAQVGRLGDDHPDLPPHGADLLLRRLQVPARAQLGDRRRAADPDHGDGLHRLPAAVRPALLLGDDRRREHQRHRADRRALPLRLPARPAPSSRPPRSRASTRSTCCSSRERSSP